MQKTPKTQTETDKSEEATTVADAPVAAPAPSKKKNKHSKRWKNQGKIEKGLTKSARRISDAISKGINVWTERRDKSAGKKKDGALRDIGKNLNKAVRKTLRKSSKAPADVFDAIAKCNVGKKLRFGKTIFK